MGRPRKKGASKNRLPRSFHVEAGLSSRSTERMMAFEAAPVMLAACHNSIKFRLFLSFLTTAEPKVMLSETHFDAQIKTVWLRFGELSARRSFRQHGCESREPMNGSPPAMDQAYSAAIGCIVPPWSRLTNAKPS